MSVRSQVGSDQSAPSAAPNIRFVSGATGRSNVLARAGQIGGAQIIRRAARFVFLFVIAKKMGPEAFGVYAILLALLETLSLISGEGFIDYLAREIARSPDRAGPLFAKVTQLRLVYAALVVPLGLAVLAVMKYRGGVLLAAFFMFLGLFARAPLAAAQGVLRASNRVSPLTWLELIQGIVLLAGLMPLISGVATLQRVVAVELASAGAGAVASLWFLRGLPVAVSLQPTRWRQLARSTATFNLYPFIANIYDRVDFLLLAMLAGNAAAGIYALPYRVLSSLQIVPFGLMAALLPKIASGEDRQGDHEISEEITKSLFTLALFPVLLFLFVSSPIFGWLLGASYRGAAPVLKLLVWASIPMFVNYGLNTFLLARGQEQVFVRTTLVCAIVNIACNALLIPRFSYYAASFVTILTEVVLLVQNVAIIRNRFGFVPFGKHVLVVAAAFLIVLGAAIAGRSYVPQLLLAALTLLVLGICVYRLGVLRSIVRWSFSGVVPT